MVQAQNHEFATTFLFGSIVPTVSILISADPGASKEERVREYKILIHSHHMDLILVKAL